MDVTEREQTATQVLGARPLEWYPPRQAISRLPYVPGLDGMRALAVVAVMVYHTNNGWLPGGFIGVEVFFVISGYLITLLLIGEHEKTGRIGLKQFWMRRARRLLPALLLMMALLMVYTALFKRDTLGLLRGDVLAGTGYVTNWYQIWVGQGYTAGADFAPLRHLWSLAVEEQFYLIWPLVMVALISLGRRRLPNISRWLALAALGIGVIVALLYNPGPVQTPELSPEAYWDVAGRPVSKMDTLYLSTFTRATGLLIGAAFAMLWRPVAVMRGPLRRKGPLLDIVGLLGFVALGALAYYLHVVTPRGAADPWLFRGGFLAVDIATVMMIAAVTHRGARLGTVLGMPVLYWIGTRSYGIYLFHWPIFQIMRGSAGNKLSIREFATAMVLTAIITELSFRLVEMPVRKRQLGAWWRKIQASRDPRSRQIFVGAAVGALCLFGFATVSMATAELKLNEVAASLAEGEDAVTDVGAQLTATTTVAPTAAPTTVAAAAAAPAQTAATTTTPTTTEAPTTTTLPVGPNVAIGDSVMLGAAGSLSNAGFTVDAEESRQFKDVVPLAQALADSGQLPEVVVVHLGTNGYIDESDAREFFELLADVPDVWILSVWVPREWMGPNNDLIVRLAQDYPNIEPAWWHSFAPDCNDDCYGSDGFHLNPNGVAHYVEAIRYWTGV